MSRTLIAILSLVIGIAVGAIGAMRLGGGAMMGAGVGSGLTTGICMVTDAGVKSGLLTDAQVGEILKRAAEDFGQTVPPGTTLTGTTAQCEQLLATLREP